MLATGGTEANVPDSITDLNGKSIPVTTIGEGAIPAVETVNVGENVNKIEKNAFKDSGAKTINFTSKVTKSMFDKNSLAGAGGKKGKGLKITVQTKKDQKAMKKALKKAGVPKAKVKIAK